MSSFNNQSLKHRGLDWPAIVKTLLVEVLVLLALGIAIVGYLNWSSDAAWAEFMAASTPSASGLQSSIPVQAVEVQTTCRRQA